MRALLFAVSGVVLVVGVIFVGQGVGLIQGSSMTGEVTWAVVGAVFIVLAALLLGFLLRGRHARSAYQER